MTTNTQQNSIQNILLGEDSYFSVVDRIYEVIKNAQAKTIQGNEYLAKMYSSLNESITPILTLKPFVTGGEELAPDDITVKAVIDKIKKSIKGNADLNFLINLCKEEHYGNMMRTGHPDPKSTVKKIEKEFKKTNNEIKDAIANGIFDDLESSLLGSIKKELGYSENQKTKDDKNVDVKALNENDASYKDHFVKYHPIGFMFYDKGTGKNLNLVENEVILIEDNDLDVETAQVIPTDQINIPAAHQILIKAVQSCPYDPETNQFSCKEEWDFEMLLNPDGTVEIKNKEGKVMDVDPEDVQQIFIESINTYEQNPAMLPKFVRERYIADADNFCALMNNANSLIRFNNIEVIRNINESVGSSNYVMIHESSYEEPKIISNGYDKNLKFDNYKMLCESCNQVFGNQVKNLFESVFVKQLDEEQLFESSKIQRLSDLNEAQTNLNSEILTIQSQKIIAQPNSPAMKKLNEAEDRLNKKLTENIEEIGNITSTKLYN